MVAPVPSRRLLPWIAGLVALVIVLSIALVAVVAFPARTPPVVVLPSTVVVTMDGTFDVRNFTGPVEFQILVLEGGNASRGISLIFLYAANLSATASPSQPYVNLTGKATVAGGEFYFFWPHAVRPGLTNGFDAPMVPFVDSGSGTTHFAYRFWWASGWQSSIVQTHAAPPA